MSGGQFDHNLSGITEGQGAKWNNTTHELVPADFAEYLHELLDVTGTASPVKGNLLVGDGASWRVLPVGADGKVLGAESTDPLGVEWVEAASGGGGGGGGDVAVQDDDVEVVAEASTLNFGANLSVTDNGSGKVTIDATGDSGGGGIETDSDLRTGGDLTINTTSYADVDTAIDLVVAASEGDVLQIGSAGLWENDSNFSKLDVATIVSGSVVNYVSGAGSAGNGVTSWQGISGVYTSFGGAILYTVQAGDIESGNVTLRLRAKVSTGSHVLRANVNDPLHWWVANLGAGSVGATSCFSEVIGDSAATGFAITHNLGTTNLHVTLWDLTSDPRTWATHDASRIEATTDNSLTVEFDQAPSASGYAVVVGCGGSGGGLAHVDRVDYTAGNITLNSTTWADVPVSGALDITIAAEEGDWIEAGISGLLNAVTVQVFMDVATIVSGSPVNYFGGTGASTDRGIVGWWGVASQNSQLSGHVPYQVQAGDIEAGSVRLRLQYRTATSNNRLLLATSDISLAFFAKNLSV